MNIQPKIEPGSPSTSHIIDRDENETHLTETSHNFEDKTIPDLVEVLRVAYLPKIFDSVEAVLVSRDHGLRDQIQLLQQNVEMEKLARLKAEEEVKKRERVCEEGKKLEQRYITLLKELKRTDLAADRETIEVLRKRNIELKEMCVKEKSEVQKYEGLLKEAEIARLVDRDALKEMKKKNIEFECEVKKLEEKRVEDWNELQVLKSKNGELESRVLELKEKIVEDEKSLNVLKLKNDELEYEILEFRKLKEKWEKDTNELCGKREKNAELENEVSELKKKWLNDSIALEELRSKARVLEEDKKALAEIEIKNGELKELVNNNLATISKLKNENTSLYTKFYGLLERVAKVEDDTKLLMSVDASGGGNNDGDAATASTQPQNIWGMDVNGASSDNGENNEEEPWMNVDVSDGGNDEGEPRADPVTDFEDNDEEDDIVEATPLPRNEDAPHSLGVAASSQPQNIGGNDAQGASSASGRVKLEKDSKIIILDDDDDQSISQRVHGKKTIFGLAVKDACPSSSVATQQKRKFTNAVVDTAKRKFSFPDIETSSSSDDSSDDSSFLDNLPISFVASQGKKTKM